MRPRLVALAAVGLLALAAPAWAVEPEEQLRDPAQEARALTITRELRCVVCQGQTVDESSAPVAAALRRLVRERITAGDSNVEVVRAVTARYGDFVLLRPRLSAKTLALWLGPFLLVAAAGFGAWRFIRAQGSPEPPPLSGEEEGRLAELLAYPPRPAARPDPSGGLETRPQEVQHRVAP